jgi:hypothetical protein
MGKVSLPPCLAQCASRVAYLQALEADERRRPLHESNVFARVKRRARRQGIILRRTRPGSIREQELGRYYAVNAESTFIEATHVRLEDAALELDVIQPGEQIIPEQQQQW